MSGSFTKNNCPSQSSLEEPQLTHFISNHTSDMNNIRSRYNKSNIPLTRSISNPSDFIVRTDDLQSNEKENDIRFINRNKHSCLQILFMLITALFYLVHTLRAYIPVTLQKDSDFWSSLVIRPVGRVYTSDLRPVVLIETLLLRLIENWQAFWLIYILTFIPRRTNFGYLYRNPNIFSLFVCFLLIISLLLQIVSQLSLSLDISCICLHLSLIFLCIACRLIAVRLYRYENQFRSTNLSIDLAIIRYFVLNSLFLYTTSILYTTMCATVEYIGIYFDQTDTLPTSIGICTTIGLSMLLVLLIIYFLLDLYVYKNEFWSIWTPYLFIAYAFIGPPLRQLSFIESDDMPNELNDYLYCLLCIGVLLILCIRFCRQIFSLCCRKKKITPVNS